MPEETFETVKYYTKARKFPQLLGRFPDGTKIPGGPYTVQQLLAGIGIIALGSMTMGIWGFLGGMGDILLLFGVAIFAMFMIGRLPMNGRNPFYAVIGFYKALAAPRGGRFQGRSVRIRKPRHLTHKTNVYYGPLPAIGPASITAEVTLERTDDPKLSRRRAPAGAAAPAAPALAPARSAGPPTPNVPLTGVQALLARAGTTNDHEEAVR